MMTIELSSLKSNPENPRTLSKQALSKLKASVAANSEFLEVRPIVVDENGLILGGNQRYRAFEALGLKEVPATWVRFVHGWSEEQKRTFIIADNAAFGEWDWDALANEWDEALLEAMNLEIPELGAVEDEDASEEALPKLSIEFQTFDDMEAFYHEIEGILANYQGARTVKGII